MIPLGTLIQDRVTGVSGIATARVEYLNGCVQYCLKRKMREDGTVPEGLYIDEGQLEVIGDGIRIPSRPGGGGPQADPPRG